MTIADTKHFKSALHQYRSEAIEILDRCGEPEFESDVQGDAADVSILRSSKEAWFERTMSVRHMIGLIDEALQRIRDGNFGVCGNCGDEIGRRRLEALPWTEYCLRCQEAIERESAVQSNASTPSYSFWKYTA
jgi:RNA polymerase-binding protein DksA